MAISAVASASPSGSFPVARFRSYGENLSLVVRDNVYESGWSQQVQVTSSARRMFTVSMRLTAATFATLDSFAAAKGLTEPFYFLPVGEVTNIIVRFVDPLKPTLIPGGRVEVSFSLLEIA